MNDTTLPPETAKSNSIRSFLEFLDKTDRDAQCCGPLWEPFWTAVAEAALAAKCTEIPVEGRWVLNSRAARKVPIPERHALVQFHLEKAKCRLRRIGSACLEAGIDTDISTVAYEFCEAAIASPSIFTNATDDELAAVSRFTPEPKSISKPTAYEPTR